MVKLHWPMTALKLRRRAFMIALIYLKRLSTPRPVCELSKNNDFVVNGGSSAHVRPTE